MTTAPPEYASLCGPRRLGDRLLEAGLITRSDLDRALERQEEAGSPRPRLGRTLVELGALGERDLLQMLSVHRAMPVLPFAIADADQRAVRLLSADLARRFRVLPCRLANGALVVAAAGPVPPPVVDQLEVVVGGPVLSCLVSDTDLDAALARRDDDAQLGLSTDDPPPTGRIPFGAGDQDETSAQDAVSLAQENARLRAELHDLRAATELLVGLLNRVRDFLDHHGARPTNGRPPGPSSAPADRAGA